MKKYISGTLSFFFVLALFAAVGLVNEAGAQVGVETSVETEVGVEAQAELEAEVEAEAEAEEEEQSRGGLLEGGLEVSGKAIRTGVDVRSTVDAWTPGIGLTTSAGVRAYIENASIEDENIKDVSINSDGSIELEYARPARFLGFASTRLTTRATIKADGSADVRSPWYRFLFAVDAESVNEADLSSEMRAVADSSLDANGDVNLSVSANRLARLIAEMRASVAVEAEAEATTN